MKKIELNELVKLTKQYADISVLLSAQNEKCIRNKFKVEILGESFERIVVDLRKLAEGKNHSINEKCELVGKGELTRQEIAHAFKEGEKLESERKKLVSRYTESSTKIVRLHYSQYVS